MIANDKDKMTLVDKLNEIAGKMTIEVERKLLLDYIREISNNMFFIERGFIWNSFGGKQVKLIMTFRESFIESEMQLIHFYEDKWNRERVIDGLEYIINGGIE